MGGDLIQTPQTQWDLDTYKSAQRPAIITLFAHVLSAAGATRYTTFRAARTTAGYQVPTGKTLYIFRIDHYSDTVNQAFWLSDGTTDVGYNSAAAPANEILIDQLFGQAFGAFVNGATFTPRSTKILIPIPEGRYITIATQTGSNRVQALLLGHEE